MQNNAVIPERAHRRAVSLHELLASRDSRQARQQQWLQQHPATLVILTVVAPGAVKDSELTRRVFNAGWQQLRQLKWPVLQSAVFTPVTGCEGFMLLEGPEEAVKTQTIALESNGSCGRLWDIDVLSSEGRILSRQARGIPERQCLLCPLPARVCTRQGTHDLTELLAEMARRVDDAFIP